ncbi:MAG: 3-ketoacyl-ACP reductase [Chloroflexota bacterium]
MHSKRRVAIVTGSARGIGRGIALALAQVGWDLVINDWVSGQSTEVAALVEAQGANTLVVQADVAQAEARTHLVRETVNHFGRIDLLVNNAGIGPKARLNILEVGEESYDEVMDVNLKAPFFLSQHVANQMIQLQAKGIVEQPMIINVSSISAYTSSPNRGEYCISKAGLSMVTALFADQLVPYGINVYEVRPGIMATDLTRVVKDKYDKLIAEGLTPIQRWGQPEDVGKAVVAIAEGHFPFSTGEVFNVDGGFHLRRL